MRILLLRLLLSTVLAGPVAASPGGWIERLFGKRDIEVITNTDVTPAGRKVPAASPSAPQYYLVASAGFRDFGGAMGGITEPPAHEVIGALTAELARRGYLPATDRSPPPTLVLFLTWGTMNVDYEPTLDPDLPPRPRNRAQILRFLGGAKVGLDDAFLDPLTAPVTGLTLLSYDARQLHDISDEDLYVAVVAAYDLESVRQKRRQLLWTTRIASLGRGFDFPDVFPAMVAIGGAQFGRETAKPVWMTAGEKFRPDVKIGELQLVEYLQGAPIPVVNPAPVPPEKSAAPRK